MKLSITRDKLLAILQPVLGVVEKRQTMPILSNILLQAKNDMLTATATDLETQVSSHTISSGLVVEDGSITASARKLFDIVRSFKEDALVNIAMNSKDKLMVTSGKGRYSLATLNANDYPEFPANESTGQVVLNGKALAECLSKVNFSMANGDVRYYLNGVMISIYEKGMQFVGADGHRLALFSVDTDNGGNINLIIPRKATLELEKILHSNPVDEDVCFIYSRNMISVKMNKLIFSTKLIDSKYPDFDKTTDQPMMPVAIVNKEELKQAVSRVMILAHEKFRGITFSIKGESLEVSSSNPEHEDACDILDIDYNGFDISFAASAKFMLEAINKIDNEMVHVSVSENINVIILTNPDDINYSLVVMPMRL